MSTTKKTYLDLLGDLTRIHNEHVAVKEQVNKLPGIEFLREAVEQMPMRPLCDPATILADVITNRDEPMTRDEIRAVFVASGWAFVERHIDEAHPDSQATVNEQAAYYRRHG